MLVFCNNSSLSLVVIADCVGVFSTGRWKRVYPETHCEKYLKIVDNVRQGKEVILGVKNVALDDFNEYARIASFLGALSRSMIGTLSTVSSNKLNFYSSVTTTSGRLILA